MAHMDVLITSIVPDPDNVGILRIDAIASFSEPNALGERQCGFSMSLAQNMTLQAKQAAVLSEAMAHCNENGFVVLSNENKHAWGMANNL